MRTAGGNIVSVTKLSAMDLSSFYAALSSELSGDPSELKKAVPTVLSVECELGSGLITKYTVLASIMAERNTVGLLS